MEGKIVKYGPEAQDKVVEGVIKAVEAVEKTLGPAGKCVAISNDFGCPEVSRDGATVLKSISFKDQELNMGAQLVRKAAELTESQGGDSTSTTSILCRELIVRGKKAVSGGANINEVKSGMLKAGKWMTEYIKAHAIPVGNDLEKIRQVATISGNNDPEVGNLIVDCMKQVGTNGVITADLANGLETVIDVTSGMKLDRGWSSPHFCTEPEDNTCVLENPYVIVINERISSVNQIIPLMECLQEINTTNRPFLLVCSEMDESVTTMFVMNVLRGAIRMAVVKGIDFGDARKNLMDDIAIACGGKFICEENGLSLAEVTPDCFGSAKKVIVGRDNTIIFDGAGDKEDIEARVDILKKRLSDPATTEYDKSKFEKRIANLAGGIAVVKAGGATEAEKLNRKATIVDAVLASKSAIAEGACVGSGYIYLKGSQEMARDAKFWKSLEGDEVEGAKIIISALPVIMSTVVRNAGGSAELVVDNVRKSKVANYGYNAKTKKFVNLLEDGILDSAKVIRVALENAISTASMILLIDCTICNEDITEGENRE